MFNCMLDLEILMQQDERKMAEIILQQRDSQEGRQISTLACYFSSQYVSLLCLAWISEEQAQMFETKLGPALLTLAGN